MSASTSQLLFDAVRRCKLRLARILLEGGISVNTTTTKTGRTPLMVVCSLEPNYFLEHSVEKMVIFLLNQGADPNIRDTKGRSCLMYAVACGCSIEIINILLKFKANPKLKDRKGRNAIDYAIFFGRTDVVEILSKTNVFIKLPPPKIHSYIVDCCDVSKKYKTSKLLSNGIKSMSKSRQLQLRSFGFSEI